MDIIKAKLLDNILLKFKGNISVYWADLHGDKKTFKDIHENYSIVENNINFLVGDGKLKRNNIDNNEYLTLTDTGFATMTDLNNLGYVTKTKTEIKERRIKYIGFGIVIATFIVLIFSTFLRHDDRQIMLTAPTIKDSTNIQDRQEPNKSPVVPNNNSPIGQDTIQDRPTSTTKPIHISK